MTSDYITEAAARWHGLQGGDEMDWDRFTLWLEADPRHRAAFDGIALLDADIESQRLPIIEHLNSRMHGAQRTTRSWLGGMVAGVAAAAAAVALFVGLPRADHHAAVMTVRTQRGQTREVALRDGSRVTLGPASRLSVGGSDQNRLEIAGSAYFDIPHRPGRDVAIKANDLTIHDIGTCFEIDAGGSGTRVSVGEGAVAVSSAGVSGSVTVAAGRSLLLVRSGTSAQVASIRASDVASWRRGALVYEAAPLTLVADDISRYAARPITVDPAIAARRFSGVLSIGDGSKLAADVAAIMALRARPVGNGVRLESAR